MSRPHFGNSIVLTCKGRITDGRDSHQSPFRRISAAMLWRNSCGRPLNAPAHPSVSANCRGAVNRKTSLLRICVRLCKRRGKTQWCDLFAVQRDAFPGPLIGALKFDGTPAEPNHHVHVQVLSRHWPMVQLQMWAPSGNEKRSKRSHHQTQARNGVTLRAFCYVGEHDGFAESMSLFHASFACVVTAEPRRKAASVMDVTSNLF
jgi:hypothetical protein